MCDEDTFPVDVRTTGRALRQAYANTSTTEQPGLPHDTARHTTGAIHTDSNGQMACMTVQYTGAEHDECKRSALPCCVNGQILCRQFLPERREDVDPRRWLLGGTGRPCAWLLGATVRWGRCRLLRICGWCCAGRCLLPQEARRQCEQILFEVCHSLVHVQQRMLLLD
eukprot:3762720-Prymnesium_polylepis.2